MAPTVSRWSVPLKLRILTLLLIAQVIGGSRGSAQPSGLDAREVNAEHYITGEPVDGPPFVFEAAFADKTFFHPQDIAAAPDGSGRVCVCTQDNRVWVFEEGDPSSTPTLYFSYPGPHATSDFEQEEGFLAMAFHPDFAENGYVFLFHSWYFPTRNNANRHNAIVRYQADPPSAATINPATRTIIYEFDVASNVHLGSGLCFGNDGYLYFLYGEGQQGAKVIDLGDQRGKLFRIDVDHQAPGLLYDIPPDNPWIDEPGALPELYARGFRNPYRMRCDPVTGVIYIGDVGSSQFEEINIVLPGAHYGWPYREGFGCTASYSNCDTNPSVPDLEYTDPLIAFGRTNTATPMYSITLGPVYWGSAFPELQGSLLYADFVSGYIGALRHVGNQVTENQILATSGIKISTIAPDGAGEPWIAGWIRGNVFQLARRPLPPLGFPTRLSEAAWIIDLAKGGTATGVLPYDVNAPLWSDHARKTRFLAVPQLEQVTYREENGYDFPEHTTIIKNFALELERGNPATRKLIETRLLIKRSGGVWDGYSFEWNDAQTDAVLLPNERRMRPFTVIDERGQTVQQTWTYPSRNDCLACHTGVKNTVLGWETLQLNRDFAFANATDNQLRTFEHIGLFDAPLPAGHEELPALADPYDPNVDYEARSKAWLHANCAMCHQAGGPTPVNMDLRWDTPLAEMNLLGVAQASASGELALLEDAKRIDPGHPDNSVVYLRAFAHAGAAYIMPPLARSEIDEPARGLLRTWIFRLSDAISGAEGAWWEYW